MCAQPKPCDCQLGSWTVTAPTARWSRCSTAAPTHVNQTQPATYLENSCASSTIEVAHTRKKPKLVNIMRDAMFMSR